jgi:drug/metabolite transporter (DMT)-like permease
LLFIKIGLYHFEVDSFEDNMEHQQFNIYKTPHEQAPPHLVRGIVISLCAYLFFISASTLVWNFETDFPTIQIIFIQNCISLLCILPLALRKGIDRLGTKVLSDHLMRDLFGVGSYYLYFLAIRYLNLVDATTLNYVAPFFVPLIWWVWMKQKVGAHVWWSIIVGFIGVAIILNPSRQIFQLGFVYGLFAGIASAIALCAVRILNIKKEPMSRTLFYYFSFGSLLTFPFAWATWVPPSSSEWWMMIGVGVATALGQILLTISYRYGTAAYLSPLGYSTVIYAGLISWIVFGQIPTLRSLLGTILIIIGGTVTYILKTKPENFKGTFIAPQVKDKPPL